MGAPAFCTRGATPVRTAPTAVCPAQIRVIDATAVERQAKNANVKTQYRHHPRHAKSQMQARVRADGSAVVDDEEDAEQQNDDGAEETTTGHGAVFGDGAGGGVGSQHVAAATTAAAKPTAAAAAAHLAPNASGAAGVRALNASIVGASNHSAQDAATAATAAATATATASAASSASPPAAARPTPASAKEAARERNALSRLSQAAARREGAKQLQHLSRIGHGGPSIPVESSAGPRSQAIADAEASCNHT
eukprot:scaffold6358_cov55-Phaeocystis_antarctica.AAC.6